VSDTIIKALLSLGINILGKFIPFLGSFLAGPFGFIAGWVISYLSGVLYDWIAQMARFAKIDSQAHKDLADATAAGQALKAAQNNPSLTKEEHAKALSDFAIRVRTLGKFRL
jgi:uncharacterized membrane protein YbaN (DUF454 family)